MDPFSHLMLGYLIGFGVWGPSGISYVIAAAVAGALPDLDVALYPLAKRFPLLRHRGISHSIFGVSVLAVVGAFVVPVLMARALGPGYGSGSTWLYLLALELGGLSHVLLDSMDHWSVPILAPFSPREYRFDADRIVNVGSMTFTVVAYVAMLEERGRAPVWVWTLTAWVLLATALGYILLRLLARWRAGRAQARAGYDAVIPQANPLIFRFVGSETTSSGRRLRIATYDLLRGRLSDAAAIELPAEATAGPVRSEADAAARSLSPSLRASWVLGETYHFAATRAGPDGFDVFWYSLEMAFWGRAAGVLSRVRAGDGSVTTKNAWRDPNRVFSE